MRLDKFLADLGLGTRSEIKKIIKKEEVLVDGVKAKSGDQQVSLDAVVTVNGLEFRYVEYEYYLLNKPAGYLCTVDDSPNVTELVASVRHDVMPAGRLDKDTEGLILLTNDGQLVHHLLSPKHHVDKTYYVETDLPIPADAPEIFSKPMDLGDFTAQPSHLVLKGENSAELTIHEGKYHQVKRMFASLGLTVTYLKRIRFADLTLEGLDIGEYRALTEEEVARLRG